MQHDEPSRPRRPLPVAIDPVELVITECITVTSAMRKHARWAHSSVSAILAGGGGASRPSTSDSKDRKPSLPMLTSPMDDGPLAGRWGLRGKQGVSMQDNPLLSAFASLRSDMKHCKDIRSFDAVTILHPFMQIIRASSTTAPITSLALIAITKMLSYGVVSADNPNFAKGLQLLSLTATHCRFENENTATAEAVFLRIIKLTELMVTGPWGNLLTDKSICDIQRNTLTICCFIRATETVRRAAEISMVTMCQVIFQRLRTLDMESHGDLQDPVDATKEELAELKIDGSTMEGQTTGEGQTTPKVGTAPSPAIESSQEVVRPPASDDVDAEIRPYALPAIRELFRVLADLLDPFKRERTDSMRIIALRIVNVALEVAGPSIALQPSLASLAKDALCRNLFELVRSENVAILHESLRVTGTLLSTCRKVLKLQQDLYLSYVVTCLHPRVPIPDEATIDASLYDGVPQGPHLAKPVPGAPASGHSTPVPVKDRQRLGMEGGSRKPDAREAMVESVGGLLRIPSFMVELFVNYDCDIDGAYLCLDMVGLLARNAFPDSATWSTTNVPPLCLDSLLTYIQFIADRLGDEPNTHGLPDPAVLRAQRARKMTVIKGVQRFNEKPTAGIAFLASQGIIQNPDDPAAIAKFLRGTTRLDKTVLGEFLSKLPNFAILQAYIDLFDFSGLRIDEAMRLYLNTFRLPGESALIERIVNVFAQKMYSIDSETWANADAVFVLSYAIIMLNTDQHNRNVKTTRMTVTDFAKNLRGVNGDKDFDQEYLAQVYEAIKTREIILPEEHDTKHASDYAWAELLVKAQTTSDLTLCNTNIYDADMFEATWRPVVATLNYVFMSATDEAVFSRVTAGFQQCAQIAARYGINECLDRIVISLGKISTLATDTPPSTTLNTEVQANGKSIMVSKFAVDFGREQRAQMATLILFRIINGQEHAIRDGWTYLIRILVNLYTNSLIPNPLLSMTQKVRLGLPPIPLTSPAYVTARSEKSADSGLFSVFTSYVSSVMNDEPPEPNDQEIEATISTIETINACGIGEIISHLDHLPVSTLQSLTSSVVDMLPHDGSPRISVKSEMPAPMPVRPNGVKSAQPQYDPALVCLLEFLTVFAMRDEETVGGLGADVARVLQLSLRSADKLHPVAVSRLTYYLLSLVKASKNHDFIRAPVILHHLASFSPELLKQSANNILMGLLECITDSTGLRNELASSPDFWSLLHSLRALPDGAPLAYQIITNIASGTPSAITADNYEPAVSLLNAFAVAGSQLPSADQLHGQQSRRGRAIAMPNPGLTSPLEKPAKSDTVVRGVNAMVILYQLTNRVPHLIASSQLEAPAAWQTYWQPIFRVLSSHCTSSSRDIRQAAFAALQRILLSSDIASTEHMEWTNVFRVVLDLLSQLLRPSSASSTLSAQGQTQTQTHDSRGGMVEIKVQSAQLLCKLFLHHLGALAEWDGMTALWSDILDAMGECLRQKSGTALEEEELPESLKNILLVMSADGYLIPPPAVESLSKTESETNDSRTEFQKRMWSETSVRLEKCLPGLMADIFPQPRSQPAQGSDEGGADATPATSTTEATVAGGVADGAENGASDGKDDVDPRVVGEVHGADVGEEDATGQKSHGPD